VEKLIKVTQGFLANEFNSLLEATTASVNKNILNKSKCKMVNGNTVLDYKFNGFSLSVHLDNGMFLLVSLGDQSIEWDVVSDEIDMQGLIIDHDIYFEFSNGDKVMWDWKKILDGFVGKKIAISPSDQFLFIYALGEKEYMFDVLMDRENLIDKYLYISEA